MEYAAALRDLRPQGPQTRQVQIDGPGPQLTAAGIAHLRLPAPGQHRSQKDGGRAHLPHQYIRDRAAIQAGSICQQAVPLPAGAAAQGLQNPNGCVHIPQPGTAPQLHLISRQQRGRQNGQYAVLCALDAHLSREAVAAPHQKLAHIGSPPYPKLVSLSYGYGEKLVTGRGLKPFDKCALWRPECQALPWPVPYRRAAFRRGGCRRPPETAPGRSCPFPAAPLRRRPSPVPGHFSPGGCW